MDFHLRVLIAEFDRVGEQVEQDLLDPLNVDLHPALVGALHVAAHFDMDTLHVGLKFDDVNHLLHCLAHQGGLLVGHESPSVDQGPIQQIFGVGAQNLGSAQDAHNLLGELVLPHLLQHELGVRDDTQDGREHLVTHHGVKAVQ